MQDILDILYYEMYMAEKEWLDTQSVFEVQLEQAALLEDASQLIVLQEGMKDTLLRYIKKVIAGVQRAWNKFRAIITDKGIDMYYNKNEKYFKTDFTMNPPADFTLPKIEEYDKFITATTIPAYNQTMNQYLKTTKDFYNHFLRAYSSELSSGKSLKDIAKEKVFVKATGKENIGRNTMSGIVRFAAIDYKKTMDKLSKNLQNLNSTTKTMESLMKVELKESGVYDLKNTMEEYFTEAEDAGEDKKDNTNNVNGEKKEDNKFKDANAGSDNEKEQKSQLDTYAKTYMKGITSVISQQMSITNKLVSVCFTMMRKYVELQKKKVDDTDSKKKEEEKKPDNTEEDKNSKTQVEI